MRGIVDSNRACVLAHYPLQIMMMKSNNMYVCIVLWCGVVLVFVKFPRIVWSFKTWTYCTGKKMSLAWLKKKKFRSNRSLSNITVVLDMCFTHLKNETNNAHKHILITTRYCWGNTPPGNQVDLLSSSLYPYCYPWNRVSLWKSYPVYPYLYGSLLFNFRFYRGNFVVNK